MELLLCSLLPLVVMLVLWAKVKAWTTNRPWYVKLPAQLAAAAAIAGIYYLGKVSAPILYPTGNAVHAEIADDIKAASPDYISLETYLPDSFRQLVEQAVQARQTAPSASIAELLDKAQGKQAVTLWWHAVAQGDDEHLLAARRKSLELDKLLFKSSAQACGARAQPARPALTDQPSEVETAAKDMDAAYAESFNSGKQARIEPLSDKDGQPLLHSLIADNEIDILLGNDVTNPAKTCELRIHFAEAALASPRAADLLRYMTAQGQP